MGVNEMKTREELNALKNEADNLLRKFAELNDEELEQVIGGVDFRQKFGPGQYEIHIYTGPDKVDFDPKLVTGEETVH